MTGYIYVYILQSLNHQDKYYTGITSDLAKRLIKHNSGSVPYTVKHRPWKIWVATAFSNKEKAIKFERYLKSHSGRVFASRHF